MFVICNENSEKPLKIWLESKEQIEQKCLEQAYNLAKLPFIQKWVALMPDTHPGKGMPIGGVIATEGVIIPNAVGSDIGCGVIFTETTLETKYLKDIQTGSGTLLQTIIGSIQRNIPLGKNHHKKMQPSSIITNALYNLEKYLNAPTLVPKIEDAFYQIGTLGGGNHFIELQENEEGKLCIMIHTGSRHFGKEIGDYFHILAKELNKKWYSQVSDSSGLSFLPVMSEEGRLYINYMNLALDFARENRETILVNTADTISTFIEKYTKCNIEYFNKLNVHHNYAAMELHFGKNLWIHRKGAISAKKGEKGIIPGAMGSYSYISEGKGNTDSFMSSSHGAGRIHSRTKAKELYSVQEVICDLKNQNVVLGKNNKKDVAEECRFAYKDIETVISNQIDLTKPIKKLKTIGVIKG